MRPPHFEQVLTDCCNVLHSLQMTTSSAKDVALVGSRQMTNLPRDANCETNATTSLIKKTKSKHFQFDPG